MSITAPSVQLDEVLTTREFQNSVYISPEEKLTVRSPAISKSKSQLTFQVRMPAPQAILENCPRLELALKFEYANSTDGGQPVTNAPEVFRDGVMEFDGNNATYSDNCYGLMREGLPFTTKCIKTLSVTQNGATQTFRPSETFKSYLQCNTTRKFAERNMVAPWNSYKRSYAHNEQRLNNGPKNYLVQNKEEGMQQQIFQNQWIGEEVYNATPADNKHTMAGNTTKVFTFLEPLWFGTYGGIVKSDIFPSWSQESSKSPSLLHQDSTSIDMALTDSWEKLVQPLICKGGSSMLVKSVTIVAANLIMDFWSPPPRYVASALSMTASYACSGKCLRYEIDAANNVLEMAPRVTEDFKIGNCSFPQMPNVFCFRMLASAQHKVNKITHVGAEIPLARESFLDKNPTIVDLRLQINTSSNCWPQVGNLGLDGMNQIINLRYSAKELYRYFLKNTNYNESIYTYEEWFNGGCMVLLTPQDMNGVLSSPSIQGLVTMTASVKVYNCLKYGIYVGNGQPRPAAQASFMGEKLEKFTLAVTGYYSNNYCTFDAKSAVLGQQTMSASFGAGLRLS